MTRAAAFASLLAILATPPPAARAQDYAPGEKLTLFNCGRCHVVGPRNRMGGIGSTPSFAVLRTFDDWEARMKAFWTLRPHPSFTQIEGVTEPFPEDRPAHVHPIRLTLDEVDRIVAYARTVAPADLGDGLSLR
jgi:mono/diheme cytochrome c family protein